MGDACHWQREHLTDGVKNGHDAHIEVAAVALQLIVTDDGHQTVGSLHHKARQTQTDDAFKTLLAYADFTAFQAQGGVWSRQEAQDPSC